MTTSMNRNNNIQQGGHTNREHRGKASRTLKSVISFLRSFQPAKTFLTYILLAMVVSSAYLIASAQSGASSTSDGVEPQGPGFIISGTVRVEDASAETSQSRLERVEIYMLFIPTEVRLDSYAAPEALITPTETPDFPQLIAVTDENGDYESSFIASDDEGEIRIWAQKDGYRFEPDESAWFHFYGYEEYESSFTAIPDVDVTITPTFTPTPTSTPAPVSGLVIYGSVRLDDPALDQSNRGLGGVEIYIAFASYPGNVVAVTNENGDYKSSFTEIPVDETVRVWAEKDGYRFIPEEEVWRFYAGYYQERQIDFLAYSDTVTVTPITPTFTPTPTVTPTPDIEPGLRIYGRVEFAPDDAGNSPPGLGGADIYLSVEGSGYRVVAVTDENGNYQSDIISMSGEHQIIVWAVKDGTIIEPEAHRWLHLEGYEARRCDFIARPEVPGVVVSGGVWLQETARADNPNWDGIPGVRIRMSISGDDIGVIAITNQAGEFESEFVPIEGASEVRVWPELAGYGFVPVQKTWQHAAGDYEEQDAKFLGHEIATPTPIITPRHTPTPKPTLIPTDTPTATPDPVQGLVVYGRVRRGGTAIDVVDDELAGFEIYVGIGPGVPTLMAITNNYGEYNSGFIPISISAPINVFAVKDGYYFEPGMYTWAHPVGFEQRQCDFDTYPEIITPTPLPTATSTPDVILPDEVFVDVPPDHPDAKYIQYLYEHGLVSGCTTLGERKYCPGDPLTRAQQAVILVRARHPEQPGYIPPAPDADAIHFIDVQEKIAMEGGDYYGTKYIQMLFDLKLTVGCQADPPLFCLDMEVTRGQLVTFAVKLRNGEDFVPSEPTQDPFNDVPRYLPNGEPNWVAKWAEQGLRVGIVQNCGTDMEAMFLFPDKAATRAEMACMVYHALTSE